MARQSPRFVLRILAVHGALLLIVLALVSLASVEIFKSTRNDALMHAKLRQELLASQTCRGIESFYSAIINDLDWLQLPGETTGSTTQPGNPALERLESGRTPLAVQLIADQLGDRVTALFVYNKQTDELTPYLPPQSKLAARDLPGEIRTWLKSVDQVRVSHLMELGNQGVSLVAAPFSTVPYRTGGRGGIIAQRAGRGGQQVIRPVPRVLVAAVPGDEIEANFLPLLNDESGASATLVDPRLQVITTSNHALVGMNLADFQNGGINEMIADYQAHPKIKTLIFTQPLIMAGKKLGPRMVTLAPVNIAQSSWTLFLAYPLDNIDADVSVLFKRAVFWAGFVAASITAILVSTALQMIRWRTRLETARHEILKQELVQARKIQEQWLPDLASAPVRMDVAAINRPASHISGDFYNWFDLPDGRHVVVIGDVTGHGMAAAFLMATTQLLVRNIMPRVCDPGRAMEEVNLQLCSQMFHGQFVTMLIMTVDFERKILEVASAGHPPPLIARDGKIAALNVEAELVVGIEKDVRYPTQRFALPEMTSLLLYTDGILDARNPAGERYGKQRLLDSFDGVAVSAADMVEAVLQSVQAFRAGAELDDDLTLVAIHLRNAAVLPQRRAALRVST